MRIGHKCHHLRVICRFDDHIRNPETLDRSSRAMNRPCRRNLARQGGKFVWHYADLPRPVSVRHPQDLRRRQVLISRTERAVLHERFQLSWRTIHNQLFRPFRPLRSDDHPFLGEEILTKFWHFLAPQAACSQQRRNKTSACSRCRSRPVRRFVTGTRSGLM